MSLYQRPLQPYDPVVPDQQQKPPIRYIRENFTGTGQDSHTVAPAQDPSMWQALTNVMPITKGVIERRWGFNQFATLSGSPNRLYNFQSDTSNARAIIAAGTGGVNAFREDGTTYGSIFTPMGNGTIRSLTSRNYQYFCDGNNTLNPSTHRTGDSLKWDGTAGAGLTNNGILIADVTSNTTSGTTGGINGGNVGTSVTQTIHGSGINNPWTNPTGIYAGAIGSAATTTLSGGQFYDNELLCLNFFSSLSGTTITGIQLDVSYNGTISLGTPPINTKFYFETQLIKNGGLAGSVLFANPILDGTNRTMTIGGPSTLWGLSLIPGDVTVANFGVGAFLLVSPSPTGYVANFSAWNLKLTVYTTGGSGSSTSSGNGVGVNGIIAGGNVNVTVGRTYYLVGNNSNTGHFSDLSSPSVNTGGLQNQEVNLLLATFNDPQVDQKYVLGTADGGDPSILYETQVLVPGLVISSWAIAANVATFTGIYYGGQFVNGQTVTIGGLTHGNYLNGQVLTVTGATATTFTAAFTHANDSSTEAGVAGQYSIAIPNNVPMVVDNCPETTLLLNQPLLFIDQSGTEFGVSLNTPPPAGDLFIKHQGRLWMAGVPGATHSIFFSKSVDDLTLPNGFIAGKYEEAWPGNNYFDISDGAESVTGLLSDGQSLYIGSEYHVRRLIGNDPTNFSLPEILHPQVGVINQEVWQMVYTQGSPAGAVWLTPDFRVIQSDFNTYLDIGNRIQDILNNLKPTASSLAHATFVADGEYDLYILSVPYVQSTYCDTHLIYDMRHGQWVVWQPTNGSLSLFFNVDANGAPQWLFIDGSAGHINQYLPTALTDNGTTFPITATTSWMGLGEPGQRKVLNEIDYDGDSSMTATVNCALVQGDFATPLVLASNLASSLGPLRTRKYYLASRSIPARYFQISFQTTSTQPILLGAYNIESIPFTDL